MKTTDIKRQLRIRIATPEDAARLVAIYAPYVENTSITFEYIVPSAEEFADRIRHTGLWRLPSMSAGIFEAAVSAVCYTKSWRNT